MDDICIYYIMFYDIGIGFFETLDKIRSSRYVYYNVELIIKIIVNRNRFIKFLLMLGLNIENY